MDNNAIKNKAISGIKWSAIERFSVQGGQFLLSIIVARLVAPADFGLIAMLTIFLAIAQTFIDSGFSNALIQKTDRTEVDFSTAFFFNIVVGIIAYAIIFIFSPYIANFYHEPQLNIIAKIVGLNVIISSFANVQRAKLTITLNFRLQSIAAFSGMLLGGIVGVVMAYRGYGVWALATMALINNTITVALLWIFVRWMPLLVFSYSSFFKLFNFGSKLLISGLLHTIYVNLYTLVIGRFFTAENAGLYNRSSTLAYFPSSNITDILFRVMYPIMCETQNKKDKLERVFLSYLKFACFIIFPMMIGLIVVAKPLILLLLTEKWIGAVPILQILCIAYIWDPIMRINNHFLYAKGLTNFTLKAEIIKKIVAILILFISLKGGIYILCWGLVVYALIDIFIITRFTKIVGMTLLMEIKNLLPIFLISIIMGIIAYSISNLFYSNYMKLISAIFFGTITYCVLSKIFGISEFDLIINFVKKRRL